MLFQKEYLVDLNGTQAAIRAGYSPKRADKTAIRLLKRPEVRKAVNKEIAKRSKRIEINADKVLQELARLAFADVAGIISIKKGRVKVTDSDKLTDAQRSCIASVSSTANGLQIKLHDKKGSLELLGKHLGLFPTRMEHSGPNGGPIESRDVTNLSDEELERIVADAENDKS